MNVVFVFLWRNIVEKKFRTFLIIASITISAALFFCSSAITDTLGNMCVDKLKQYYGDSDIVVMPDNNTKNQFFNQEDATSLKDKTDYIYGAIQGYAGYKYKEEPTTVLTLLGINMSEMQEINPIKFEQESIENNLQDNEIIISKKFAEKYNYKLGDDINLQFNGISKSFQISGIAKPTGPFMDESTVTYVITSKHILSKLYNQEGKVNILYIKSKKGTEINNLISEFSKIYPDYEVKEPITQEEIEAQVGTMTNSMIMLTAIVFLLSVFIIYSSFQVVALERLPIVGTLRSVGCTKRKTNCLLLLESIIYGIFGGILGNVLGIGILYCVSYFSSKGVIETKIEYSIVQLIATFVIAIILSIVSSIIPIKKVSKIPLKDIILNMLEKPKKRSISKSVLGIAFVIIAIILPRMASKDNALYLDLLSMILSVAAIIILVPLITNLFALLLSKIYQVLFGNVGIIATKNIRNNKSMYNSIALLAIGISCILMTNIVSGSVGKEVLNAFHICKYDIMLKYSNADDKFIHELEKIKGVDKINAVYAASDVQVEGTKSKIATVQGVDIDTFNQYLDLRYEGDAKDHFNEFKENNGAFVSTIIRDRFGIKEGDSIELKLNNKNYSYKVLGFYNTLMFDGDYAIISADNLKKNMNTDKYNNIFIKTNGDPDDVVSAIKEQYSQESFWISTVQSMIDAQIDSNKELFIVLYGFSIIALLIGILGVVNNLIISFIERKRSFAIYRSIGMSKSQLVKMVFIESITGGIIGSVFGILAGILLLYGVYYALIAMELPMNYYYTASTFIITLIGGILVTLFASISPMLKSSKLNIIESIKYE